MISSDSLRLGLIYYYENQFPRLLSASLHEEGFVKEWVTPYFMANFLNADVGWTPRNYEAVRANPYLRNACAMKLSRLENRILPYYEKSLEMVRNLLGDIERELVE